MKSFLIIFDHCTIVKSTKWLIHYVKSCCCFFFVCISIAISCYDESRNNSFFHLHIGDRLLVIFFLRFDEQTEHANRYHWRKSTIDRFQRLSRANAHTQNAFFSISTIVIFLWMKHVKQLNGENKIGKFT